MSGFKLKDIFGSIGSKLNIKSQDRSSPTSQQAYQKAQLKRPAHQKESKFQYDTRMRREAKKGAKSKGIESSITSGQEIRGLQFAPKEEKKSRFSTDQGYEWNPLTKKFESTFDISKVGLNVPEMKFNPNDKRDQSQVQNFGIIPGMSFGEAFAQAGKGGAKTNQPFFWTNPDLEKNPEQVSESYLYAHEEKPTLKEHLKNIASENPNATAEELANILRTAAKGY